MLVLLIHLQENHDRKVNQYERNYLICNDIREFWIKTAGKAIYVMTHPMTESARRVYPPKQRICWLTYSHLKE